MPPLAREEGSKLAEAEASQPKSAMRSPFTTQTTFRLLPDTLMSLLGLLSQSQLLDRRSLHVRSKTCSRQAKKSAIWAQASSK